ncbi:MAG: hypothetical protein H6Q73_3314 [Firmicutes bacterium]|nr:hypothetical protein [Bacillota bacterium]
MRGLLYQPWLLILLIVVNALGTLYGVYWYADQLQSTPWYLWWVVPDSPLHAALFGVYLYWIVSGRLGALPDWLLAFAWAAVLGVIKYGLWTTVILSQYFLSQGMFPGPEDFLLLVSHGGMALEGLIYMGLLPRRSFPALLAVFWLGLNDFVDYRFFTHPHLPQPDQVIVAANVNVSLTVIAAVLTGRLLKGQARQAGD